MSLTDYEIRDLNDEINSLMREKRHWETQIVALGGANYKRAQSSMTDDAGREVPGTRGYKWVLPSGLMMIVASCEGRGPRRGTRAGMRDELWLLQRQVNMGKKAVVAAVADRIDTLAGLRTYLVSRSYLPEDVRSLTLSSPILRLGEESAISG